jgi:hypothetical protein
MGSINMANIPQTLAVEANYQQLTNKTTTETNSCTLQKELPMWTILVETL